MSKGYNGYTNYETWSFNLHEGNYLQEVIQEYQDQSNEKLEYGAVYEIVDGHIDQMLEDNRIESGLFNDFIGMGVQRIDTHQIATNIHEELEWFDKE